MIGILRRGPQLHIGGRHQCTVAPFFLIIIHTFLSKPRNQVLKSCMLWLLRAKVKYYFLYFICKGGGGSLQKLVTFLITRNRHHPSHYIIQEREKNEHLSKIYFWVFSHYLQSSTHQIGLIHFLYHALCNYLLVVLLHHLHFLYLICHRPHYPRSNQHLRPQRLLQPDLQNGFSAQM